jgi:hypothetical protein
VTGIEVLPAPGSRRALAALQPGLFAAFVDQCFEGVRADEAEGSFEKMAYPHFKARALVLQVDSPRNVAFQPWINANPQVAFIDAILKGAMPPVHLPRVVLFLPERWLNPVEQTLLMQRLHQYAEAHPGLLTQVDLVTQCPIILTDFSRSQIRILTTPFPL